MLQLRRVKFLIDGFGVVFISVFLILSSTVSGFFGKDRQVQAQAHYMMGLFYENQQKYDQAIAEYRQAAGLEKDIPAIRLRLGASLIRKGDFKNAALELEEAKRLEPDNLEAGLLLALLYSIQNSSEKATKEYEEVLKKAQAVEPGNTLILKSLAVLYHQQKKLESAISTYRLILDIDKSDHESVFLLGSLLEETGRRQEAVEKFKEALELKPDYSDALNSLGYLYAEEGRNLAEAEEFIKKALIVDPDNGAYIDSLGWVYFKMGFADRAIEYLEKASALLADPVIYDHLGDAYFKNSLTAKAIAAWKKSLELGPEQDKIKEKIKRHEKNNG